MEGQQKNPHPATSKSWRAHKETKERPKTHSTRAERTRLIPLDMALVRLLVLLRISRSDSAEVPSAGA